MKYIMFLVVALLSQSVLGQTINPYIKNVTPDARYTVNNDGTVTDNNTNLMWMQCSEGQTWDLQGANASCESDAAVHTWDAALALARDKVFAGHSDWRLPNIKELASLVAADRHDPSINSTIFPATPSSLFWSATPFSDDIPNSMTVFFYNGGDSVVLRSRSNHVRLVRSLP